MVGIFQSLQLQINGQRWFQSCIWFCVQGSWLQNNTGISDHWGHFRSVCLLRKAVHFPTLPSHIWPQQEVSICDLRWYCHHLRFLHGHHSDAGCIMHTSAIGDLARKPGDTPMYEKHRSPGLFAGRFWYHLQSLHIPPTLASSLAIADAVAKEDRRFSNIRHRIAVSFWWKPVYSLLNLCQSCFSKHTRVVLPNTRHKRSGSVLGSSARTTSCVSCAQWKVVFVFDHFQGCGAECGDYLWLNARSGGSLPSP